MIITIDLDNTIFDISWIYEKAWDISHPLNVNGKTVLYSWFNIKRNDFVFPKCWNYHNDKNWSGAPAEALDKLFADGITLTESIIDPDTRTILNNFIHNPMWEVYLVTDRPLNTNTYKQIDDECIDIDKDHVITTRMKVETIKYLKSDLHIDDAPHILDELDGIPKVVISNDHTVYNHNWVNKHKESVLSYKDVGSALCDIKNILTKYKLTVN